MKLVYFAWIKTTIGHGEEETDLPAQVKDVAGLLDWLESRGPQYAAALTDRAVVRVAVNQEFAQPGNPVENGDEVALFPPVTGGKDLPT